MKELEYILVILLVSSVDFITLIRTYFVKPKPRSSALPRWDDFNILIPIFGNLSYLKNVDYLKPYGNKVILCTTTKESPEFNQAIELLSQKYGFRIFRSPVPLATSKGKPNPWRLFSSTLRSDYGSYINLEIVRDEIIREGTAITAATYSIFLDGDTTTTENLEILAGMMKQENFDLASVRVLAASPTTMMEKLQAIEYELAMDTRRIYPWLTSGAGMIAKTQIMKEIMAHHSLFFSGGDIEIGKLAKMLGYKVGHLNFEFFTDVPSTFTAWFKQRMAWFGGGFRHAIVNFHQFTWKNPMFYLYTTVIVYALTPLRIYEIIQHPEVLLIIILIYWLLIFTFHWNKAKWYYLLFPFYSLIQVLLILPFGVYTYFKMAIHSDNPGFIRLRPNQS